MIQEPLIAIADIHAHHEQIESLVNFFRRNGYLRDHKLVLLGDVPDRGPNSRAAIDLTSALVDEGHICVKGNHDFTLESALGLVPLAPDVRLAWVQRWVARYEAGLLQSYGLASPPRTDFEGWLAAADTLRETMPQRHKRLFCEMPWFVETKNLILVHAGLAPDVPWEEQRRALLEKQRNDPHGPAQIFSHALADESSARGNPLWPKRVVSGHAFTLVARPVITPARVLLDCGVEFGWPLIAWVSDTEEIFAAAASSKDVVKHGG